MPLPAAVFSAFPPVLLFGPLAAAPRGVALARLALEQFVPLDTAFRLVPPDSHGWMYGPRLTPSCGPRAHG